jgi:hypothetical protein
MTVSHPARRLYGTTPLSAASDDSNPAEGVVKKMEVTMVHDANLTPM